MTPRVFALVTLLTLPLLAGARGLPPAAPTPPGAAAVDRAPVAPLPAPDGVTATLAAPRRVAGTLPLTLTLKSVRPVPVRLDVGRDNDQNCAFAPTVRVLRVGTREVVYPAPGEGPRICTQELLSKAVPARGSAVFTRDLDLAPGEYMIEGWFAGFADEERVKIPAQPVRVTVR